MHDRFLLLRAIPYYHKILLPEVWHEENTQTCKNLKFWNLTIYLLSFLEKHTFLTHHISLQMQNGLPNCFDSSELS